MRMAQEEILFPIEYQLIIHHSIFTIRAKISPYGLEVYASMGWESLQTTGGQKDDGLSGFVSLTRIF